MMGKSILRSLSRTSRPPILQSPKPVRSRGARSVRGNAEVLGGVGRHVGVRLEGRLRERKPAKSDQSWLDKKCFNFPSHGLPAFRTVSPPQKSPRAAARIADSLGSAATRCSGLSHAGAILVTARFAKNAVIRRWPPPSGLRRASARDKTLLSSGSGMTSSSGRQESFQYAELDALTPLEERCMGAGT